MTNPIPTPAELINNLLTQLAIQAAERVWGLVISPWYKRDTVRQHIQDSIRHISSDDFAGQLDRDRLGEFLSSPEVVGIVDRLLALRLVVVQRPLRAPEQDLPSRERGSVAAHDQKEKAELRELQSRPEAVEDPHEAYSAALRRECRRLTQLWFGMGTSVLAGESIYPGLSGAADAAYAAIAASSRPEDLVVRPDQRARIDHFRVRPIEVVATISGSRLLKYAGSCARATTRTTTP